MCDCKSNHQLTLPGCRRERLVVPLARMEAWSHKRRPELGWPFGKRKPAGAFKRLICVNGHRAWHSARIASFWPLAPDFISLGAKNGACCKSGILSVANRYCQCRHLNWMFGE